MTAMPTRSPGTDHDEQVHRALSSPVRRQIVRLLSSEDVGRDARVLADQLQLHVNTVRSHLAVLEDAGLVASDPEARDRPGRPRLLYRATDLATAAPDVGGYRFLAEVLASHLAATADDPAVAAQQAGAAWGRFLVESPAPYSAVDRWAAITRVVELMEAFGFAPELDDTDPTAPAIRLHRCPFLDVAKEHQDVVCSVHLGIMRGALDELGGGVEARDLVPFAEPGLCVSHLSVPRRVDAT